MHEWSVNEKNWRADGHRWIHSKLLKPNRLSVTIQFIYISGNEACSYTSPVITTAVTLYDAYNTQQQTCHGSLTADNWFHTKKTVAYNSLEVQTCLKRTRRRHQPRSHESVPAGRSSTHRLSYLYTMQGTCRSRTLWCSGFVIMS